MEKNPFNLEDFGQEKEGWDLYGIVSVLSDLISRQRGYPVEMILVPKDSIQE